jgi:prevent-host-death family protein
LRAEETNPTIAQITGRGPRVTIRNLEHHAIRRRGVEDFRKQLPELLEAAQRGESTIITKHGRPVAALVPISAYPGAARQQSLLPLAGTGKGLWGRDSRQTIRRLKDEWGR